MTTRRLTRAGVAIAAAAAVGLSVLALGQSSSQAARTAASDEEFSLVGRSAQGKDIDVGRKGPSVGDRFVFSENLFEEGSKERIGRLAAFCDVSFVERNAKGKAVNSLMQCIGTFRLPDGQIGAQGAFRWSDEGGILSITGGSGDYESATGVIRIEFENDTKSIYEFEIDERRGGVLTP